MGIRRRTMIYKCRNCGGNVVYDPDRKEMHCPYCDGTDTQDKLPGGGMETCATVSYTHLSPVRHAMTWS